MCNMSDVMCDPTCDVKCVMCNMSDVMCDPTCDVKCVMCNMSDVMYIVQYNVY